MPKDYKNLIIFIAIIFLITGGTLFYFLEIKKIQEIKLPEAPPKTEEYSYENITYNFWGVVQDKEGYTLLVEGIIPEPGKIQTKEEALLTIKFKITDVTRIVKLENIDKESKPVFVNLEIIQPGDQLALKADYIDKIKKTVVATDILILPSLPPRGTTTPPVIP